MQSKVINQTLNPIWENQTFSLPVTDPGFYFLPSNSKANAIIKIECWDRDPITNDFMGQFDIPVVELAEKKKV